MASRSLGVLRKLTRVIATRMRSSQPATNVIRTSGHMSGQKALLRARKTIFQGPTVSAARLGFCLELGPLASDSNLVFSSLNRVAGSCLASIYEAEDEHHLNVTSLEDLETGPFLCKGCNGAVYAARLKDSNPKHRLMNPQLKDWPLVFKMVFNYSDAHQPQSDEDVEGMFAPEAAPYTRLPEHPNIAKVHGVFVEKVPTLPKASEMFPNACPPGLYPELGRDCFGSDKTLFIIMKRYSCSLSEKLASGALASGEAIRVLLQLLEADVVMKRHGIAHRDIHARNVLIDEAQDGSISACIADFGCSTDRLRPYPNSDFRPGSLPGAPVVQAPECSSGRGRDYSKADVWAIAALAFNFFQPGSNPFLQTLDAKSYRQAELPRVTGAPGWLNYLLHAMLQRDPAQRPSAEECADALQLFLLGPRTSWLVGATLPSPAELREWLLLRMARLLLCFRMDVSQRVQLPFFCRLSESRLKAALIRLRTAMAEGQNDETSGQMAPVLARCDA